MLGGDGMRHGGNTSFGVTSGRFGRSNLKENSGNENLPPTTSYRNVFHQPGDNDSFNGLAFSGENGIKKTVQMLAKLARKYGDDRKRGEKNGNPNIPAGYTYLGQFVAHDLSFNPLPLGTSQTPASAMQNVRSYPLLLGSVFGTGPETMPWLYEVSQDDNWPRTKLRIGRIEHPEELDCEKPVKAEPGAKTIDEVLVEVKGKCPLADIPRILSYRFDGAMRWPYHEALIADQRNDDSLLLSQLTLQFHFFYNKIVDKLLELKETIRLLYFLEKSQTYELGLQIHNSARILTVAAYHQIIRNDFLSRLLDQGVYDSYLKKTTLNKFKDCAIHKGNTSISAEFSFAAYRVGHTMVRQSYPFGKVGSGVISDELSGFLFRTGQRRNNNMPLSKTWIIPMDHFFDTGKGVKTLKSARLTPTAPTEFCTNPIFRPISSEFDEIDIENAGLPFHDLVRCLTHRTWKVARLFQLYGLDNADEYKTEKAKQLANAETRKEQLKKSLSNGHTSNSSSHGHPFKQQELEALSNDPPLSFYVLFEAEYCHEGKRLGPLGSTIIAETIFASLIHARKAISGKDRKLETDIFPNGLPDTMGDLLNYICD
jgi:hypothetical protein